VVPTLAAAQAEAEKLAPAYASYQPGYQAYRDLTSRYGYGETEAAQAAEALRQAGIPGIRYLDQGSRDTGVGTHNTVVFDDKLIDVLRKYGIAGLFVAGGAAAGGQPQQ
jgi:hypothetical protein